MLVSIQRRLTALLDRVLSAAVFNVRENDPDSVPEPRPRPWHAVALR